MASRKSALEKDIRVGIYRRASGLFVFDAKCTAQLIPLSFPFLGSLLLAFGYAVRLSLFSEASAVFGDRQPGRRTTRPSANGV